MCNLHATLKFQEGNFYINISCDVLSQIAALLLDWYMSATIQTIILCVFNSQLKYFQVPQFCVVKEFMIELNTIKNHE